MTIFGRNSAVASMVSARGRALLLGGMTIRTLKSPAYRRMMARKARNGSTSSGFVHHDPSILDAKDMPKGMSEMDNHSLVSLAAMENHEARIEVLKRHIMSVDNVSYDAACDTFDKIQTANHRGMSLATIPYLSGITVASVAGIGSIPLCFYLPAVSDFNDKFVTFDVPEAKDLETALEVGSWAWNWMEPPLGTLSFMLLCLQFSRAQMNNLGMRPFTSYVKQTRADRLCREYPGYDKRILSDFSKTDDLYK